LLFGDNILVSSFEIRVPALSKPKRFDFRVFFGDPETGEEGPAVEGRRQSSSTIKKALLSPPLLVLVAV
jgi:hypothetical protein